MLGGSARRLDRRALLGLAALAAVAMGSKAGAEDLRGRELRPKGQLVLFPRAPTNPVTGSGDPSCIVQPEGAGLRVTWVRRDSSGGYSVVRAELLPTPALLVRRQADVVGRDGTVRWVELAASATAEPLGWAIWPED